MDTEKQAEEARAAQQRVDDAERERSAAIENRAAVFLRLDEEGFKPTAISRAANLNRVTVADIVSLERAKRS